MRKAALFALGAVGVIVLAASPALANQYVTIRNAQYIPKSATIQQFDTIFWTHVDGDAQHSVTAVSGQAERFDSSPDCPPTCLQRGDTFKHTFKHAGTFAYYCRVHCPNNSCAADGMRGTIVVRALAAVTPVPTAKPTPSPVPTAVNSVSVTTPVPTPSPTPSETPLATPSPTLEPTASAVAAPKTTSSGGIGAALGLVIAGVAIATLGGSLLFVRLRRPSG